MRALCMVAGCEKTWRAKGMCEAHYRRWRRTGSPHPAPKVHARRKVTSAPGSLFVQCGDCAQVVAVVSTRAAVWQALAAHTCQTP